MRRSLWEAGIVLGTLPGASWALLGVMGVEISFSVLHGKCLQPWLGACQAFGACPSTVVRAPVGADYWRTEIHTVELRCRGSPRLSPEDAAALPV